MTTPYPHSHNQARDVQDALNHFTEKFLKGVKPIRVDGDLGPATNKRIIQCKYWLGFTSTKRDHEVTFEFRERLWHPRDWRYVTHGSHSQKIDAISRGVHRRYLHNRAYDRSHKTATKHHGVVVYDGVHVAAYFVPILDWARHDGYHGVRWHGRVMSGFRTPAYSQHLCIVMCGHPTCAGRCAGIYTNHAYTEPPRGAVDVTDYVTFGELMPHCPHSPRIFNHLPIDPVHFSPMGN